VKRQLTMPVGVVWLVVVASTWVLTSLLLAVLIKTTDVRSTPADVIGQAAASATYACVVVGGASTAVALRVRRRNSLRRAVLSGIATTVLVLLFSWSYVAASGTSIPWAWQPLLPLVIVTGGQLWLALRLHRRCRIEAGPVQTSSEQESRSDELPPD
jgi:uncharacterized membrane-anchored protein